MKYQGTQYVEDKRNALAEKIMFLTNERRRENGRNFNKGN